MKICSTCDLLDEEFLALYQEVLRHVGRQAIRSLEAD